MLDINFRPCIYSPKGTHTEKDIHFQIVPHKVSSRRKDKNALNYLCIFSLKINKLLRSCSAYSLVMNKH